MPTPLINKKKKFILFWMPKCGCTTVSWWFFKTLALENKVKSMPPDDLGAKVHYYRDRIYLGKRSFKHQRLGKYYKNPRYFKFVVVRNPYWRIVGSYIGIMHGKLSDKNLYKEIEIKDEDNMISFSEFLDQLGEIDLHTSDNHFRYQISNDCWRDDVEVDYIVYLEDLAKGLDLVNKKFNFHIPIEKLYSRPKTAAVLNDDSELCDYSFNKLLDVFNKYNGIPHYKHFYNSEILKKIQRIYEPDISTLGYSFNDPFYIPSR